MKWVDIIQKIVTNLNTSFHTGIETEPQKILYWDLKKIKAEDIPPLPSISEGELKFRTFL